VLDFRLRPRNTRELPSVGLLCSE